MTKVVVFGTGVFLKNRIDELKSILYQKAEIVAYIDNKAIQIKEFDGINVILPEEVKSLEYEMIVLMSVREYEMKSQLLELGVSEEKIYTWETFKAKMLRGHMQFFCGSDVEYPKEKVLILTKDLGYHGGAIAAVYAAKTLQKKGYNVFLAAVSANREYIDEVISQGLNVVICPAVLAMGREEQFFIKQFDVAIVNGFPMLPCAVCASDLIPVLWWMHECDDKYSGVYSETISKYSQFSGIDRFKNMHISAVSDIAQRAFNVFYPNRIQNVLPLGILDERIAVLNEKKEKIIFAIIGLVHELKNQHLCIDVIDRMTCEEREKVEFWLIGRCVDCSYTKQLIEKIQKYPEIKICGQLSREEIKKAYTQIDVVVCTSLEETLSLTIAEGMMHEKVCITSDTTGIATYIKDGENGYVFESNNADKLLEKIREVISHYDDLDNMRKCARKTYEDVFTLEGLGDRLEIAVYDAIQKNMRNVEN